MINDTVAYSVAANGCEIITHVEFAARGSNAPRAAVLARGRDNPDALVLWWVNMQTGCAYAGGYYINLQDAWAGYSERVMGEIKNGGKIAV